MASEPRDSFERDSERLFCLRACMNREGTSERCERRHWSAHEVILQNSYKHSSIFIYSQRSQTMQLSCNGLAAATDRRCRCKVAAAPESSRTVARMLSGHRTAAWTQRELEAACCVALSKMQAVKRRTNSNGMIGVYDSSINSLSCDNQQPPMQPDKSTAPADRTQLSSVQLGPDPNPPILHWPKIVLSTLLLRLAELLRADVGLIRLLHLRLLKLLLLG
jgi:hypothetical protein